VDLKVPRVRDGSFFPSLLEPRKRAERALAAVVQQAYIEGVSTRRVDDLVKALGMEGISRSQVSRICEALDEEIGRFRTRSLAGEYPYVWLDATFLKVRDNGRVVSMAVVVAIGVRQTGEREVLSWEIGPSEDGAFWLRFLRGLVARGLRGAKLVVSDAHEGLKQAIAAVFQGASWQRCRVHTIRTQLLNGRPGAGRPGRHVPQLDDVTDLQCVLTDDYTLDQQLQDSLLVLERRPGQPTVHPLAEDRQAA
jgi:transposase-like protein